MSNLTEDQNNDFEKLSTPKKGLFNILLHAISSDYQLVNKNKKSEEGKVFLVRFHILNEIHKELINTTQGKDKLEAFKFSKTDMANEFEIDKKTLNKWLELLNLNSKYFKNNKRLISFNEYNEIFKKLFTESEEDFDLKNKFEDYYIRFEEKKTLSKKDIVRLGFNLIDSPKTKDYDRAKEIIQENKDFDFYQEIDKYPYAIAIKLINYLNQNHE